MNATEVIELLDLRPLPEEGGFFKETYTSGAIVNGRPISTAIYYLLTPDSFSALHRLKSDELFHFYLGGAVEWVRISAAGTFTQGVLGSNLLNGQRVQQVFPAGDWFGSRLAKGGEWALIGCTVAPGFDYRDFEIGTRASLVHQFPDLKSQIEPFTR